MNPQEKAWATRRGKDSCIVCNKHPVSSRNSKTCCKSCSAKLAWITGKQK